MRIWKSLTNNFAFINNSLFIITSVPSLPRNIFLRSYPAKKDPFCEKLNIVPFGITTEMDLTSLFKFPNLFDLYPWIFNEIHPPT